MYSVSPELYREVAERLLAAVGHQSYYSGTIAFECAGADCRFQISVIVYRERRSLPEGSVDAVSDLVPVWWEFHTACGGCEFSNDFSFSDLRRFVR